MSCKKKTIIYKTQFSNKKKSKKAYGSNTNTNTNTNTNVSYKTKTKTKTSTKKTNSNKSTVKSIVDLKGYKEQRDFLDDEDYISINPLTSNPRRGMTGPHYFATIYASFFNTSDGNNLTKKEVIEYRKELIEMYPNANLVLDILKYNGVDQKEEGACSFVGFLNLIIISGNKIILTPKNIHNSWKKFWKSFGIEAASDIGEVLDKILQSKLIKETYDLKKMITYIPIRSEKNREMSFNKQFYVNGETDIDKLIQKYNTTKEVYEQVSWIYQNANLIESIIDSHRPVLINALEHTRTCVGYNDDYLLFADNWTKTYEQDSDNGTDDYFKGGFSIIKKWAIYSWMRDIVYFN